MLATEARKNASEIIWDSLPHTIRYNIEDAVNEGRLMCEITFSKVNPIEADEFNKCIEYFQDLNELGYRAAMHKTSDHYVITIMW
jgi:hypothetical protein